MVYTRAISSTNNSQHTFTQIVDELLKYKSTLDLNYVLADNPELFDMKNSRGQSLLHFAAQYKNQPAIEAIVSNKSIHNLDVTRKCVFGFTPAHMLFLKRSPTNLSPKLFYESLIDMNSKTMNAKHRAEIRNIGNCLEFLYNRNRNLVKSSDGISIYSLVVFKECEYLKKVIVDNFNLSINDVTENLAIEIYLKMAPNSKSKDSLLTTSYLGTKICSLKRKLAVFIKHGVLLDDTTQYLTSSLKQFYCEPQNCHEIENYFTNFLDVAVLQLMNLLKSVGLTHPIIHASVADIMSRVQNSFHENSPKHYDIRKLYLILLLNLVMYLEDSLTNSPGVIKNLDDKQTTKAYNQTYVVSFYLHRIWLEDQCFKIDTIAVEVLNFVKAITSSINCHYDDLNLIITTNTMYAQIILILYILHKHIDGRKYSEAIFECFQFILKTSIGRENLLNILLRPVYFLKSFSHFSIDIEPVIQFMIDLNVPLNLRDCWSGFSALHQAAISYPQSAVVLLYLLDHGAYPFSLDSQGDLFCNKLSAEVRTKVLKHYTLVRPWTLQTLCNFRIVSLWPNLRIVKPFISSHIYRFVLLHAKPT